MNVFISIIEEAYASTKIRNQSQWIYSYLKIDPNYVEINNLDNNNSKTMEESYSPEKKHDFSRSLKKSLELPEKEHKKIMSKVKSQNILNEIISDRRGNKLKMKQDYEKNLEIYFLNVLYIFIID